MIPAGQVNVGLKKLDLGFVPHGDNLLTGLAAVIFDILKPTAVLFELLAATRTRMREKYICEGAGESHDGTPYVWRERALLSATGGRGRHSMMRNIVNINTLYLPSALSRFARTDPADPAPTTI
jgi:hypothetical protein